MTLRETGRDRSGRTVVVDTDYGSADSPTHAVVKAIAEHLDLSEMEPLYDRIDTGALHALLDHARTTDSYVRVEFTVGEHTVVLDSDQRLLLHDGEPASRSLDAGSG